MAEEGKQGWVPLRLVKQQKQGKGEDRAVVPDTTANGSSRSSAEHSDVDSQHGAPRLPVVLLLHSTGADMDSLAEPQARFARRGYLAAAIDSRYHGGRSTTPHHPRLGYEEAIER